MSAPQGTQQAYHFPPAEPQPAYGYSNPQLLTPQQWPQHGEPQAYELNYQAYSGGDPGPFQHGAQQGYADGDAEFEEYYEDDEPRRGPRWFLIAAALVGAIGVGGALAYTYRSLVAPTTRVPIVKADPNVKVRPEQRGGREFPGSEAQAPVRVASETPPSASQEEAPGENVGPRSVKTIPITPGSVPAARAPAPAPAIPGITLYQPPERPAPAAAAPAPAPQPEQERAREEPPSPPARVSIGTPPPAAEKDDDPPAASPPRVREPPVRSAAVAPKPPPAKPRARPASSGLGYVAVLVSKKTSIDALKEFADLQQKYGDVLGDKTPDVQAADLSARGLGTMYRLVVGPPGSRSAARGVCNDLKTAGYQGCWVKEY